MARADDRWISQSDARRERASDIDLVVAGSRGALVMVEGGAKQVPEPEILAALKRAHQEIVAGDRQHRGAPSQGGRCRRSRCAAARQQRARGARARAGRGALAQAVQIRAKHERYCGDRRGREGSDRRLRHRVPQAPAQLDTLSAIEKRQAELRELSGT
jgi:polyribonucleotide nucleotidyltransferase